MPRYIDEKDVYALVEPRGVARVHCSQIDELSRADVISKREVEKIFEQIEAIIDNNSYKSYLPNSSLWSKEYKINQIITELAELKKKYVVETSIVRDLAEEAVNNDIQKHLDN